MTEDEKLKRIYQKIFTDAMVYGENYPMQMVAATYMAIAMRIYKTLLTEEDYEEMLKAIEASDLLITDSGGLQKEAYWALKPCFTLRSNTEWTETVSSGWNVLVDLSPKSLKDNISDWKKPTSHLNHYGDGYAANNILSEIINF